MENFTAKLQNEHENNKKNEVSWLEYTNQIEKESILDYSNLNDINILLSQIKENRVGEFLLKICVHFYLLRNYVENRRKAVLGDFEKLNSEGKKHVDQEIYELSDRFIRNIESTKNEFCQNFTQEIQKLSNDINNSIVNQTMTEKNVYLFRKEFESKLAALKKKLLVVDYKLDLKLKLNRFEETNDFLGKLYLNNFQSEFTKCVYKKLYSNGDSYEGDWINNKRNGQGTYTWKDGDIYEGEWVDNKRIGKGKMLYINGDSFEGEWIDTDKNREWFGNSFLEEKINGNGKYVWANGNYYEGNLKNSQRHGKGKMVYANGEIFDCNWLENRVDC
jgi:hypothetical protein